MEKICNETTTKKIKELRIYANEECGNKAKFEIEYTLNGKLTRKKLCKRHYTSVTSWLERIKVSFITKALAKNI